MVTLATQHRRAHQVEFRVSADTLRRVVYGLGCLSAVVLSVCLLLREYTSWRYWGDLNPTSGVWIATADDAVHGELYRPLISDIGYGGTRYAPLRTLLQAEMMRTGMDPVRGALLVSLGGTIALLLAGYFLMRRLEVPRGWAAILTCFLLSSNGMRTSLLAGLADPLAAFLDVAGLILVMYIADRPAEFQRRWVIIVAAVLFALAMATKVTSVFGIGAAIVFLISRGKRKESLILAAIWGGLVLSGVAAIQWASGGRMFGVFRACATAGEGLRGIIGGPSALWNMMTRLDRSAGGFWAIAIVLMVAARRWMDLPVLLMAGTTAVTMLIVSTPGTGINHLIDVEVASVICIGTLVSRRWVLTSLASITMSLIVLYASYRMVAEARQIERVNHRQQVAEAISRVKQAGGSGPLLCNDPLIPILVGERPYILDGFMFRVLLKKTPAFGQPLWDDLSARKFRSVVLMTSSTGPDPLRTPGHFGAEVVDRVEDAYRSLGPRGAYYIFVPEPTAVEK